MKFHGATTGSTIMRSVVMPRNFICLIRLHFQSPFDFHTLKTCHVASDKSFFRQQSIVAQDKLKKLDIVKYVA